MRLSNVGLESLRVEDFLIMPRCTLPVITHDLGWSLLCLLQPFKLRDDGKWPSAHMSSTHDHSHAGSADMICDAVTTSSASTVTAR